MIKSRYTIQPWIAVILSLFFPGLGLVYSGCKVRAVLWLACLYSVLLLLAFFTNISDLPMFYVVYTLQLLFYLFVIVDSYKQAFKRRNHSHDRYSHLRVYILFAVGIWLIEGTYTHFRSTLLGVDHYRLASGSMTPRLQEGDYVIIDTRVQSRNKLAVGDVVVFKLPSEQDAFVKRIAGVAGDEVEIRLGKVYRNGVFEPRLEVLDQRRRRLSSQSMSSVLVKDAEVFTLGDWRDNSKDSRARGNIPLSNILGKVTAVWFSRDFYRIGRLNNQLIIQQK